MREIKQAELIPWPESDITDNFEFEAIASAGTFVFKFKWLNDRWNLWVTLPDGTVKQAGTVPEIISWTGSNDYGLILKSSLDFLDYNSLFMAGMYLITWQ